MSKGASPIQLELSDTTETITGYDWADEPMTSSIDQRRDDAVRVFRAGVQAADPHSAVLRTLKQPKWQELVTRVRSNESGGQLHVIAVGKAGCTMARAAASCLPSGVFRGPGIIVVNKENLSEVPRFRVFGSGHPVPDEIGVQAAAEVRRLLENAREEDTVLLLVSGGGSALLPAPVLSITLQDKVDTTRLLLASGADIGELNTVRKHLSTLKGGGAVKLASPARVEALLLSDVVGDDLSTIASGLTAPDPTTHGDTRQILERRGIWDRVPEPVRRHIMEGVQGQSPETPKPGDPIFQRVCNRIVGSNRQSLEAACREAEALGYQPVVASRELTGEAREAGNWLARFLEEDVGSNQPAAVLAGGETTVTLRGQGHGGRNQELALSFALTAERLAVALPWVFLSGGTDGRDGPTDAAGALVDPESLRRGRQRSGDPDEALRQNDSYSFFEASGDLLKTGATGTNVADLQILLIHR